MYCVLIVRQIGREEHRTHYCIGYVPYNIFILAIKVIFFPRKKLFLVIKIFI